MTTRVPLMDLATTHAPLRAEIDAAVGRVLDTNGFILGPEVAALEREVAAYVGVEHAVGVASGTDALILALRALDIGPGDEVIVPAFTFFATGSAVMLVGATPVLVDVDPDTYCLDLGQVEAALTPRTKAIIPVHLFGHPADMDALRTLAEPRAIAIIEDNAQAIGAEYRGRRTGGLGTAGCLSFYPSKNLGAAGDAGMVLTDDPQVGERVRMLRTHGWKEKYFPEVLGQNSRLDAMQAAILRVKLPHLDGWNDRRRALAERYHSMLADLPLRMQDEREGARSVYHLFVIEVAGREAVAAALKDRGVDTAVYYPYPLHQVPAWAAVGAERGAFPVSERLAREALAIPLFPEMTDAQQDHVVASLREILG